MTITQYLHKLHTSYQRGIATEHTYRPFLKTLLESLVTDIEVINEPKRIACGSPDYQVARKAIPIGYIEAKDIGLDLGKVAKTPQLKRYLKSLNNLILTDYVTFVFFKEGKKVATVSLASVGKKELTPTQKANHDKFIQLIQNFCAFTGQTITSAEKLAKMMAAKARLMKVIFENALNSAVETGENTKIVGHYNAFQETLIKDISVSEFADIYAQTIAYGMFAARFNDDTPDSFSRIEAAQLIPKTNPFLRQLFQFIAGYDLEDNVAWIVDELVTVFLHTSIQDLLKDFGKTTQRNDPIIHFYETFLKEYDPKLRKARGVYYTPEPVVNFIVRAVDDILKTEFGLKDGLANTDKIYKKVTVQGKKRKGKERTHKVQILDPATGTGTFLSEIIKYIHLKYFKKRGLIGAWSGYVQKELIPRLHGFEIMMASYAMCHLKLSLLLQQTNYDIKTNKQRLKVYLTNSLEEMDKDYHSLFANAIAQEGKQATKVKLEEPIMIVMGNPPYAVSSSNKGEWIKNLIGAYKKDLKERKINLDDDYIKFIRYGEYMVNKTGEGILAYISNNSFIDGITHRQMRKHLLETFDKIYILDLHGNAKKKETAPDGTTDQNVFDIMQGVSINIFVKTKSNNRRQLAEVYHYDLYGKRQLKYDFLWEKNLKSVQWQKLEYRKPYFFFVPKDFELEMAYGKNFYVNNLFNLGNNGIEVGREILSLQFNQEKLKYIIDDFVFMPKSRFIKKYNIKDSRDWKYDMVKEDVIKHKNNSIVRIQHKPFDYRYTLYTGTSRGFHTYPSIKIMSHLFKSNNTLIIPNQAALGFKHCFTTKYIASRAILDKSGLFGTGRIFPLYLYPKPTQLDPNPQRIPNLNKKIIQQIAHKLKLQFVNEKDNRYRSTKHFAPIDLLDYIYAILHSPTYRTKYKEFLKIDFPRIPYPKDKKQFWAFAQYGSELRQIHLLEHPVTEEVITSYPIDGTNAVLKSKHPRFEATGKGLGKVWINKEQYFENVPLVAWEFYIGGYQPAQKWLKDRRERVLDYEAIYHYQRIIVALTETERLMKAIDKISKAL